MADNKDRIGNPDRQRINTNQDYEVRDWARRFGVSEDELKSAVSAVGNDANTVREHLRKAPKRA